MDFNREKVRLQDAAGPVTGSHVMGVMNCPSVHRVAVVGEESSSTELVTKLTSERVEEAVRVGVPVEEGVGVPEPETLGEGVEDTETVVEPETELERVSEGEGVLELEGEDESELAGVIEPEGVGVPLGV